MPPRHGKSELCSHYLPAWFLGTFPSRRVILSSYEADFAARWGRKARGTIERYGREFFGVRVSQSSSAANRWDIEGDTGGMDTAGIGGAITGKGADLLIIDDPVKNAEDAASETYRERVWDWWRSTAYTRLEPNGAAIVIQTRWHEDDLTGRILSDSQQAGAEQWRVVNLPAIADEDDALGRVKGEALWPERFNLETLERYRQQLGNYFWSALYQQSPAPSEGGIFKKEWLPILDWRASRDIPGTLKKAVRAWDKAATEGGGDYSAGVLLAEQKGIFYVVDVSRGQWSTRQREDTIAACAAADRNLIRSTIIHLEQEPGSSGKDSAAATIRNLVGYDVHAEPSTGDKVTRARPFAAQCAAGNVQLVAGPWNRAFIDELASFPKGKHDDQVDAVAIAFNKLAAGIGIGGTGGFGVIQAMVGGRPSVGSGGGVRLGW